MRKMSGFTLIELMIVVAIIAVLAAIAIPIYQKQVQESRRTSAKTTLLDVAAKEEKYYATNNAYTADMTSLGYANALKNGCTGGASSCLVVTSASEDYYSVSVLTQNSGANFTASATPIGAQKNDDCGTFIINDQGVQQVSGAATNCW